MKIRNTPESIVEIIQCDPEDLTFDQAESVLAIVEIQRKRIARRLHKESGLFKYAQKAAA